jgi:sugar transferase (PEP-CTERM/EpsH1 system associated)
LPYAPNRGDRIRAYYLLRELSAFADVDLFSLIHDDEEAAKVHDVPFVTRIATARTSRWRNAVRAVAALPTRRPLTHALLDAPHARRELQRLIDVQPPDVVLAYCSGMARFALEPPLAHIPFVLDMVDVDSAKWADLAGTSAWPHRWIYRREARTLGTFEAEAATRAVDTLVVSPRERDVLLELAPSAHVTAIPNGVDVEAFMPSTPPADAPEVVFTGIMDYGPNVDAVVAFATQAWPRVRHTIPHARFTIVGARPVSAIQALATRDRSITVTGRVDAVQPYLWRSAVAVAPLTIARGLQNKVLEALAAGVPVVISPAVAMGLPAEALAGCAIAADSTTTVDAVLALLAQTPAHRRAKAASAGIDRLTWSRQFAPLRSIVTGAIERSRYTRSLA